MVLVKCEMCDELHHLESWEEGMCFICVKCAKILQKIKKKEIEFKYVFSEESRIKIFDSLRFNEIMNK